MKTIGIVVNISKPNWLPKAHSIVEFLVGRGLQVAVEPPQARAALFPEGGTSAENQVVDADMVLSLGGDGTFLKTVRIVGDREIPILGINLGGLGFLAEVSADDSLSSLEKILAGDYQVEERMTLQASLMRDEESVSEESALNDVVIGTTGLSRLANLEVCIDEEHLTTYESDGLILSSPTGSTAYSLSAGGPIVHPALEALLLTPICPHALSNRPLLVPPERKIKVHLREIPEGAMLTVDGQKGLALSCDDVITVARSSRRVRLITTNQASYFEILRSKLGWGGSKDW
jgi:NAD+ kinase